MRTTDYYTRPLKQEEYEAWDQLVALSPQGTFFHQTAWLRASGKSFDILGCFDGTDELVGGIPALHTRRIGMVVLRPTYFMPYSGPVIRKVDGKRFNQISTYKKITAPLARAIVERYPLARVNIHYAAHDIQPFLWQGFVSRVHYTYLVDLENLDEALKEIDVDRRNDIRKGIRDGLVCEEGENLETFIPLLRRSLQVQGIHWSDRRMLEFRTCYAASAAMGRGKIFFVRDGNGQLLGGAWLVWDQYRSYYLLVGMDRDLGSRTAVPALVWHLMRFTREVLALRWFDFDGADVPQIENFVRAFGGYLTPFFVAIRVAPAFRPFWLIRQSL